MPETALPADREGHILVVDDEPSMRSLLSRLLSRAGYQVSQAADGREALERINRDPPDMVVCDWMMPGMDGLEVCRRLKSRGCEAPFTILLSARRDSEDFAAGLDAGADGYIVKPVQSGEFLAQVRAGLRIRRLEQRLVRLNHELHHLAVTDSLTQVANRRAFTARLDHELDRQARSGEPLGLLMIDVDNLKRCNDSLGHHGGDEALRGIARAVNGQLRRIDLFARWGGDEFAVLLPGAAVDQALACAQRLCQAVQQAALATGLITLSIGAAAAPDHGRDPDTLLHAADGALYEAKRTGRNRALAAPSPALAVAPRR